MVASHTGGPPGGGGGPTLSAGYGALVDGSAVASTSKEATMLFHSVTFIVPDADGVTATNGARVEWLDSFTYFAYRGIYLTDGTLGRAGLGIKYGAEFRSIGSANVYGTYGAVADGPNTLGYLVGHNFGYVGSGSDSQNDNQLSIQANEIVELNSGKLYYDSLDHKGDYRVGDIFFVEQSTGNVSFNAQAISFTAGGSIVLTGPTTETIINAAAIQTGNIRVHDNNIDSLVGAVNVAAASGKTYLNTDVNVTGNVAVTGDTIVKGNVFIGDTPLDLVRINPKLTQSINPGFNNTYNLGVKGLDPKVWNIGYFNDINIDGITEFANNTISTLVSNYDLRLQAAGTGKIKITSTDVQIDNNLTVGNTLTVNGNTSLIDTEITGTTTQVGNIDQTGDTYITGLFSNNNIILQGTHSYISVPSVKIQDDTISATATDSNLQFTGNGVGGVIIDNKLKVVDNTISNIWPSATTDYQKSIILSPNGTGNVVINSTAFLTVPVGNDTNKVLSTAGEIRQNSTTLAYEGHLSTGNESFLNVYSSDRKTYITPELTVGNNDNTLRFVINNASKATINSTSLSTAVMQVGDFIISGSTINNPFTGVDTIIEPTGTGHINANGTLFKDSTITNTANTALVLSSTGIGYYKFTGAAVVFPYGNNSQRRLTPEVGETRYNTEINYMEVFNGTTWIPAVGTLGAAPLSEVLDIMDLWSLVLG